MDLIWRKYGEYPGTCERAIAYLFPVSISVPGIRTRQPAGVVGVAGDSTEQYGAGTYESSHSTITPTTV